ncbi:hypothetical protein [Sulfuricurvum sp.]|uniref:hypothetical protein n=1 Tax=Sulfuricurvum sp. TaxID=2025608 RepID=UPI003C32B66E
MKTLLTIVSASAILSTFALAETPLKMQEQVQSQVKNETQNRFKNMGTDDLLQQRGTVTSQREREQLHNELMNRQQTMNKEQKEKFNKRPENRTPKMKNQGDGKGMMQGQSSGMGGGMGGGGKGGR